MATQTQSRSGQVNGELWGAQARDWGDIQKRQILPVYEAVLDRLEVGMPAASLVAALKPLLPLPPPDAPGPFALSEESALRGLAQRAGLAPEAMIDVDSPFSYPDLAIALRGLNSSGVAIKAMRNTSKDALNAAHTAALARFKQPDGSYRIGATFRCLLARA